MPSWDTVLAECVDLESGTPGSLSVYSEEPRIHVTVYEIRIKSFPSSGDKRLKNASKTLWIHRESI